jgi:hypothetical protein
VVRSPSIAALLDEYVWSNWPACITIDATRIDEEVARYICRQTPAEIVGLDGCGNGFDLCHEAGDEDGSGRIPKTTVPPARASNTGTEL